MVNCWCKESMDLVNKSVYNRQLFISLNGFPMINRCLGVIATSLFLTACGGSSSSNNNQTADKVDFIPSQQAVEEVKVVDALNRPLSNAEVVFTPVVEPDSNNGIQVASFSKVISAQDVANNCFVDPTTESSQGETDAEGDLSLEGLKPGLYEVEICKGGVSVTIEITISADNSNTSAVLAAPVTVNNDVVTKLPNTALVVSVSGIIFSDEGPVANAQIAISGGALTNGAITTAITDSNGFYSLVINVNISKLAALKDATIEIVADGYENINIGGQDFTDFGAFSGVNLKLNPVEEDTGLLVYSENFEINYQEATCGEWTSEALAINENQYFEEGIYNQQEVFVADIVNEEVSEVNLPESLWHSHASQLNIINQAYLKSLVSLAPNDQSQGAVPNPIEGSKACWYGRTAANGSIEEGNFLNEVATEQEFAQGDVVPTFIVDEAECLDCSFNDDFNGGTSKQPHSGALVSPRIDLSNSNTPLALTFKTWWEIEAVNPNENGFDLMSVEYKIEGSEEGEGQWVTLARLNPLTDPVINESINLSSIPYSNLGFNQAPIWLKQAPISLDRLAGKAFHLRFVFSTQDPLYNGFRGWLLDDVKITKEEGTFPLWDEKIIPELDPEEIGNEFF